MVQPLDPTDLTSMPKTSADKLHYLYITEAKPLILTVFNQLYILLRPNKACGNIERSCSQQFSMQVFKGQWRPTRLSLFHSKASQSCFLSLDLWHAQIAHWRRSGSNRCCVREKKQHGRNWKAAFSRWKAKEQHHLASETKTHWLFCVQSIGWKAERLWSFCLVISFSSSTFNSWLRP